MGWDTSKLESCIEKQSSQPRSARSVIDHLRGARNGPKFGSKYGTVANDVGVIREKRSRYKLW